ncbi:hypothetical protein [Streptococcus sp. NLN76]|uniref:hypothetical protein n=1 Tax=Streptococcus sp. NLN76 TaxID=2822800 RepID=UPI0018AB87A5|nr:hypothetical protein [Streptococcus sp. NLN76]MBF8970166.1 hypothetical protein [Streptococcus sp. NLN76]
MNKRIKKKRELEEKLRIAESHIDFLIYETNRLNRLVERNAQATNNEFEAVRKEIHEMRTKRIFKKGWL